VALDWWNGCRVPLGDSSVSGLLLGMNLRTSAPDIYRALLESLCFGARSIIDHLAVGGAPIERVILTSGLSQNNVLLMQLMADILGRDVQVPQIRHATAVSAAIHGAVASANRAKFCSNRFGVLVVLHDHGGHPGKPPPVDLHTPCRRSTPPKNPIRAGLDFHSYGEIGRAENRGPPETMLCPKATRPCQ
jgi:hypothetical protein